MAKYVANIRKDYVLVFWLILVAVWFVSLNSRVLIHPDEGRYATISLEMLQSGDWITPRLNGFLYFEKPILQYWISSVSFLAFGYTDFAARFWPGLSGILTVLLVWVTGRRLWDARSGCLAALVCAGSTWIIGNSHFLTLDMGETFFLTLTLCAFLLAQRSEASTIEHRNMMWLAWAGMAAATLSKGLIGLLIPGAALFLFCLIQRKWTPWRHMHWLTGGGLFLLLTAPWFYLVSERNPDFAHFFFIHEHFDRFLTTKHHRQGPFWYFVPIVFVGFLPWTSFLPKLVRDAWKANSAHFHLERFLLSWCLFVFVFFSASGSKLPSYILPMFPAMALLLGGFLARSSAQNLKKHLILPIVIWGLVLLVAPFIGNLSSVSLPESFLNHFRWYLGAAALVFLLGAALARYFWNRRQLEAGVMALAMASMLSFVLVSAGQNSFSQLDSSVQMTRQMRPYLTADMEVFSVRTYDQTLPYYLQRPVTLVEYVDEFNYGQEAEPERWIANLDDFSVRWQKAPQAMALLQEKTYQILKRRDLPMNIIYQDPLRMVVIKP